MRLRALLLAIAGVGLALAAPAAAGAAPHSYPIRISATISVSTTVPREHSSITITGAHFYANASVRLELHTKAYVLTTVQSSATGTFSVPVTLPAGVTGQHTVIAETGAANQPSQVITISGATSSGGGGTTNGGGTALTGVDIAGLLALALALILAGSVLALRGRRSPSAVASDGRDLILR